MARSGRFFVAGCQRSGTTLLRLVLECHPRVYCFDEAIGYRVLAGEPFDVPAERTRVGFNADFRGPFSLPK
jgi:Sulfotransferase family